MIPSFPWIAPGWRGGGAGRDKFLPSGNLGRKAVRPRLRAAVQLPFSLSLSILRVSREDETGAGRKLGEGGGKPCARITLCGTEAVTFSTERVARTYFCDRFIFEVLAQYQKKAFSELSLGVTRVTPISAMDRYAYV